VASLYAEAAASLGEREPGGHIFGPGDNLLIGNVRFEARIDEVPNLPEAERVDRVAFVLDGRRILTRNRPPYAVTLDLGPVPRSRTLRVEGLSRDDRVLAVDEMALNAGAQRFAVRLVEPRPDRAYRRSLRARAEIEPPAGQTVERVEFYYNEDLVATLYQPPYSQPIAMPGQGAPAGYVRAVAYLAGGDISSEDVVLLNTPESPDAMDVRLVELYTAVVDEAGRPVEGLGGGDFQVAEDGVRQSLRRVERVTDIPVRVVELIDNSGSMRGRMGDTRKAALGFLRRTLLPIDQAAVITFNQAPQVAVGFTRDMTALEEGFTGLVAEDYTSLYDSIAFALNYLTGVKGQRAILLLSDGEDRSSRFGYDQILEYARRSGITLYAIGLDLPEGQRGEAARKLERLAAETGGRSFFLTGTGELDAVYQEIERDLRSQYRLTYQSSNTGTEDVFRAVDVQVGKAGLDARTISGYYP
jgi:Ca-activated chloride channel family protein